MTIDELAEFAGVDPKVVYVWVLRDRLPVRLPCGDADCTGGTPKYDIAPWDVANWWAKFQTNYPELDPHWPANMIGSMMFDKRDRRC